MKPKIIWKKRWKEDAVSPVIATILMVAITVVLAAVLYMLVTVFFFDQPTKPNINLGDGRPTGVDGEWKINVNSIDRPEDLSRYKIAILNGTDVAIEATPLETVKESGVSSGGLTLRYKEPNSDDTLNAGDYFILGGTDSTSDYIIEIHYMNQGKASTGGEIEQ